MSHTDYLLKKFQALILVLIPSKGCQFRTRSQELKPMVEYFNKWSLPTLVITHNLQKPASSYRERLITHSTIASI
jgi:hypothetical protein